VSNIARPSSKYEVDLCSLLLTFKNMNVKEQPDDPNAARVSALAGDLRVLIGKLKRRLREQAHLGDLTWSQLSVLSRLERDGPATGSGIAAR
jgi:hypothetical protein